MSFLRLVRVYFFPFGMNCGYCLLEIQRLLFAIWTFFLPRETHISFFSCGKKLYGEWRIILLDSFTKENIHVFYPHDTRNNYKYCDVVFVE